MSVRGWVKVPVQSLRGAWSVLGEKRRGKPSRASLMQNARISPGIVATRPGTSSVLAASGKVTGLFNWVTPAAKNLVLYEDANVIKAVDQNGLGVTTILDSTGTHAPVGGAATRRPVFADIAIWTYLCGYDTTGAGTFAVRVTDGTHTDIAFRDSPVLTSATWSDLGTGNCTQGPHWMGVVMRSRSGFTGPPVTAAVTTALGGPIGIDLNAGLRKIGLSVTLPACTDGGGNAALLLVMTRADNPSKYYFIPNDAASGSVGEIPIPLNTITTFNFIANFSDEDIASLDSADDNFLWATNGGGIGNGPAFCSVYGTRMCYGVGRRSDFLAGIALLISNPGQAQQLAVDQNSVYMPNQRVPAMGFQLPNSPDYYITGDRWTARITDNGDKPSTWAPPIQVSEALGAPFPGCVCYRTRGNYAWMATERGIEIFDGAFGELPITYLVADQWARVNWKAAYAIETADDTVGLRFYCAVPLDGATEPSHLFVVDYTNGMTFDSCDISLDKFNRATFSSIGAVKEAATGITNLWIGPAAAGNITHFDTSTKNDEGAAIDSYWESGLIGGQLKSKTFRVQQADIWIRGAGTLAMTWYGPDRVRSVTPALLSRQGVPAALAAAPGFEYQAKTYLSKIENMTCRFGTNAAGAWFELSSFALFVKEDVYNR